VIGSGCLLYSVVLSYELHPHFHVLDQVHTFVSQRLQQAAEQCGFSVSVAGTCDLTWNYRKFSGNSLRCKSRHLLYHGTVLYNANLSLLANCLTTPPREPAYRGGRTHADFITNVPLDTQLFSRYLQSAFSVQSTTALIPQEALQTLLLEKYARDAWHSER
jgi:lipoate-protein ligase A